MNKAQKNTMWSRKVRTLLKDGYGVDDISIMTKTDIEEVRLEVKILRETGQIKGIVRGQKNEQ